MRVTCREGSAEPAAPCRLEGRHVEHAAVAIVIEGDRAGDVLAVQARDQDMEGGRVDTAQQPGGETEHAQMALAVEGPQGGEPARNPNITPVELSRGG